MSHIDLIGVTGGGAVELTTCGPGSYSQNNGAIRCEKCPPGTFSNGDSNTAVCNCARARAAVRFNGVM
jgi:hypothetical protein